MIKDTLLIVLGLLLLFKGGDYLVLGSVNIARSVRLSPMVIGLTVIGFGTSMPELLVSTKAAIAGSPGIAIGNVVGSNIANICLILGVAALIFPLTVSLESLRKHLPFMILSVLLLCIAGMTGTINRIWGIAFLLILLVYVNIEVVQSRRHPDPAAEEQLKEYVQWKLPVALLVTLVSFVALVLGANVLVNGATSWAMRLGEWMGADAAKMERIIGLTVVAVGTSLPELFASVMAARRHQADMALGNIVGSVSFNILAVIGMAATICPIQQTNVGFLLPYLAMLVTSLLLYIFCYTRKKLERWEGAILLCCYAVSLVVIAI